MDYAVLFEVMLPLLVRVRLPIPLGGTSNHFRRSALLAVNGWDSWNVTEDADIGFQLHRAGYRAGLLRSPTLESAPSLMGVWIRQRSRWLKGHMQTALVLLRAETPLNHRGLIGLMLSLMVGLGSAFLQLGLLVLLASGFATVAMGKRLSAPDAHSTCLTFVTAAVSLTSFNVGAHRARLPISPLDPLTTPIYWVLQAPALVRALWQLALDPYRWDKTEHQPGLDVRPSDGLSGVRVPASEPHPPADRLRPRHAPHSAVG
jgi:hypothetical protein